MIPARCDSWCSGRIVCGSAAACSAAHRRHGPKIGRNCAVPREISIVRNSTYPDQWARRDASWRGSLRLPAGAGRTSSRRAALRPPPPSSMKKRNPVAAKWESSRAPPTRGSFLSLESCSAWRPTPGRALGSDGPRRHTPHSEAPSNTLSLPKPPRPRRDRNRLISA